MRARDVATRILRRPFRSTCVYDRSIVLGVVSRVDANEEEKEGKEERRQRRTFSAHLRTTSRLRPPQRRLRKFQRRIRRDFTPPSSSYRAFRTCDVTKRNETRSRQEYHFCQRDFHKSHFDRILRAELSLVLVVGYRTRAVSYSAVSYRITFKLLRRPFDLTVQFSRAQ